MYSKSGSAYVLEEWQCLKEPTVGEDLLSDSADSGR